MANRGPSRWRLVRENHFRGAGWLNAPAPNPGGVSQNPGFPSPSRTVRGGSPPSRSFMSMQLCNQLPHTMWQVGQLCIYTPICCLGNQVTCMIAEYHLTTSARQLSLHLIIPHEVAPLLPPLKNYVPGVVFKGTQDMRVMDHAMALRVAIWPHRLDMAVGGEVLASETLEALQHYLGLLLESFLTPRTSNLTYQEVVDCVLMENRWASKQSLCHLQGCRTCDWETLEGLIKAHGELDKADKAAQKSLKKEIDQRHKSLETIKERISHYEAQLRQEPSEGSAPGDDSQICHSAQAKAAWTWQLMMLLQRVP